MLSYMILKVTSNVYTEGLFKMYFLKSLDTKRKLALANSSRSSRCFFHREKKKNTEIQDGIFRVAITTDPDGVLLPSISFLSSFLLFPLNVNNLLYSLRYVEFAKP